MGGKSRVVGVRRPERQRQGAGQLHGVPEALVGPPCGPIGALEPAGGVQVAATRSRGGRVSNCGSPTRSLADLGGAVWGGTPLGQLVTTGGNAAKRGGSPHLRCPLRALSSQQGCSSAYHTTSCFPSRPN